jgi:hypothetical protein
MDQARRIIENRVIQFHVSASRLEQTGNQPQRHGLPGALMGQRGLPVRPHLKGVLQINALDLFAGCTSNPIFSSPSRRIYAPERGKRRKSG